MDAPAIGPRKSRRDLLPRPRHYRIDVTLVPTAVRLERFMAAIDWAVDLYRHSPLVERLGLVRPLEEFFKLSTHWVAVVSRALLAVRTVEVEHAFAAYIPGPYRKLVAALLAFDRDAFLHWVDICFRTHQDPPRRRLETPLAIDESWVAAEDYRTILPYFTPIGDPVPPAGPAADSAADDAVLAALPPVDDQPVDPRPRLIMRVIRAMAHLHAAFVIRVPSRTREEPLSPVADVCLAALHAGEDRAVAILAEYGLSWRGSPLEDLACLADMTTTHAYDVIKAELAKADAARSAAAQGAADAP